MTFGARMELLALFLKLLWAKDLNWHVHREMLLDPAQPHDAPYDSFVTSKKVYHSITATYEE